MARTAQWKPKRIRSEEDRRSGSSQFLSIDEGENFVGYALFEADPSVDDPAYYEFAMHWIGSPGQKGSGSVPCADDNCPLCEDGDRPKTRAYSLWLVTQDANKNKLDPPQLGIWEMNYNVIKMFTEWRAEGDKIKGRLFRVGKLDDRGNYNITPKTETMSATAIKTALKDPNAPDFDGMITSKLRKAMEGMAVARAVEDDDEDETPTKGRKTAGKPAAAKEKPATKTRAKAWPDELDEEDVTVSEVDDDGNYFVATADGFKGTKQVFTTDDIDFDFSDLSEDDVVTITADPGRRRRLHPFRRAGIGRGRAGRGRGRGAGRRGRGREGERSPRVHRGCRVRRQEGQCWRVHARCRERRFGIRAVLPRPRASVGG